MAIIIIGKEKNFNNHNENILILKCCQYLTPVNLKHLKKLV